MRLGAALVIATGCGGGGQSPPKECCVGEQQAGQVSLTIADHQGLAVVGHEVVFVTQDGRVMSANTDGAGTASAEVFGGVTVAVVDPFGPPADGRFDVRSIAGIVPPAELFLLAPFDDTISVTIDAPPDAGATSFEVRTSCGDGTIAQRIGTIELHGCHGIADVIVVATDASGPRGAVNQRFPVDDGATLALLGPYHPLGPVQVNVIGGLTATMNGSAGILGAGALFSRPLAIDVQAGQGSATAQLPNVAGTRAVAELAIDPLADELSQYHLFGWDDRSFANLTLDLTAGLGARILERPLVTPRAITWLDQFLVPVMMEASPPPRNTPDLVVFELEVERGPMRWTWQLIAPYQFAEVEIPPLPQFAIQPGDTTTIRSMLLADPPGSYFDVRGQLLTGHGARDLMANTLNGQVITQQLR